MKSNTKAVLLLEERVYLSAGEFVERVLWRVPEPVRGSTHDFKYRLAYVAADVCVIRYDNEAGKGDHKHLPNGEVGYHFRGIPALFDDFEADVAKARRRK